MIRRIPTVALLIGALAVAGQAEAHGGGGGWEGPAVFGAIVGSAIVRRLAAADREPREKVLAEVGRYAAELTAAFPK